ncbi:MAG: hypothetical protein COW18_05355 [Zetaproteobacteria bacterium CG12_big_fil_rev_8_21_14_0_65_54_13]|nr:MAG: hypothetical protein COW18_05355 [Zetaproteobacteria bacterium CG12_big_fil_rev_8_21_14_0_65_54_13]
MLSIQKKFLFIHIPKTGGSSLQNILSRYSEDKIVCDAPLQDGIERFAVKNTKHPELKKHSSLMAYKSVLDQELFKSLYKFAVIRNPWERMISFYFSPHRGKQVWSRENFIQMLNSEVQPVRDFIRIPSGIGLYMNRLRLGGFVPPKPLDYNIDYLLKIESLDSDFKHLCEIIDIPYETIPVRNQSQRSYYTQYYDEELRALVEHRFIDEIRCGNYEFGRLNDV